LLKRIQFYLKVGIWISKKVTGKEMLPAKILAWNLKVAIGSGVLESLVAHQNGDLNERILRIVRIQASFTIACCFFLIILFIFFSPIVGMKLLSFHSR
jgi:regulator of protease activity HflC (stomatin/prohibitin superfamily)